MKRIAIDFDGVLNNYSGWKGENNLGTPREGVKHFLEELFFHDEYQIIIFTCRDITKVNDWLLEQNLQQYITAVTDIKPQAHIYIDDRGLRFDGDFKKALQQIRSFKTYWED